MPGTLAATITKVDMQFRSAAFTSAGFLDTAALSQKYPAVSAAFTSAGFLSATATRVETFTTAFTGTGALTATSSQKYSGTLPFTGTGTLSATATVAPTPLTIVGTPVAGTAISTITLPTHAIGDIIIVTASISGSTVATKPAAGGTVPTWTDIDAPTGGSILATLRTAYAVATATNHTSGSWTNARAMMAIVLRGQHVTTPIGGHAVLREDNVTTATAPAITLSNNSGSSMVLHFHSSTGPSPTNDWAAAPAGYTRQISASTTGTDPCVCLNTKDVTTTAPAIAQPAVTAWTATDTANATIEILE